ncbi:hypothetical protein LINGRAHAP2_LOCUS23727, partial [Linum grandiflorum]
MQNRIGKTKNLRLNWREGRPSTLSGVQAKEKRKEEVSGSVAKDARIEELSNCYATNNLVLLLL